MYIPSNKLNSFNCVEIIHQQEKHQSLISRLKSPEQPTDVAENQLIVTEVCWKALCVSGSVSLYLSLCVHVVTRNKPGVLG